MNLFKTVILNDKTSDDDEVVVPPATTFIITSENKIIHTNNYFSHMVNRDIEQIIGTSYTNYIPDAYRDAHTTWI